MLFHSLKFVVVNVYYVMGFRPSYFTCIAHLYLYYTLLISHTYASYIRHWCVFSHYEIQYKSSSISNMVSELLLWPFLSSLVFISVTPFSTSLPPSQQPPQPFDVEPLTSLSCRPWVSDLQLSSLRSFTLHRPLLFASCAPTRLLTSLLMSSTSAFACAVANVTCLHQPLTSSFDSGYLTIDF